MSFVDFNSALKCYECGDNFVGCSTRISNDTLPVTCEPGFNFCVVRINTKLLNNLAKNHSLLNNYLSFMF